MTIKTDADYRAFCELLEKMSGISLGEGKQYLVVSRLRNLMKEEQVDSLDGIISRMRQEPKGSVTMKVIDAMTTNETLWFRDVHPFEILKNQLLTEHYKGQPSKPLRMWSAACSTGQEPYSISMTLEEFYAKNPGTGRASCKIVATDLSDTVLAMARQGEYASLAIGRGLSPERLKKFFTPMADGRSKIRPELAARVEFRKLNLLESYALLGRFDIVFCRNVLIYFTADVKKQILTRIHSCLQPGGYLLLGGSESLNGMGDMYEMVHCRPGIIYRKK